MATLHDDVFVSQVSPFLNVFLDQSNLLERFSFDLKGAQSRYFELFWPHTKLPLNGRKP